MSRLRLPAVQLSALQGRPARRRPAIRFHVAALHVLPGLTVLPALLLAAALVRAEAPAQPPAPSARPPAQVQPPAPGPQLFLSPAGKPYRSPAGAPYPVADWFQSADTDADGRLTRAEFIADGERYFVTLDSSRNGQLEAAEIDAYEAAVLAPLTPRVGQAAPGADGAPPAGGSSPQARPVQMPASAGGPRFRQPPDAPRGAGRYGIINIRHPIKAADQDMNARVTAEEWRRILNSRFDLLDTRRQGYLRLDELPPTPWQEQQPGYKPRKP